MNFFVGGKYVAKSGLAARTIERIHGDDIYWRDDIGPGRCSKKRFEQWGDSVSPENSPSRQVAKRAKSVTQSVIKAIKNELPRLQAFRAAIAEIKPEIPDEKVQELSRISLGLLVSSVLRLENQMQDFPGYSSRLRMITRMDTDAATIQKIICSLNVLNDYSSEARTKVVVTKLLQVLSEGSDCLGRLRALLVPFLTQ